MHAASPKKDMVVIKKYANRRLYDTGTSRYVTLEDVADMVKRDMDLVVQDAKTGEDLTRSVLTQIIFEQESKGYNLLPISFLRRIIGFYDDSLRSVLPSYLENMMESFAQNQDKMRNYLGKFDQFPSYNPFNQFSQISKQNFEMFESMLSVFKPFNGPVEGKNQRTKK